MLKDLKALRGSTRMIIQSILHEFRGAGGTGGLSNLESIIRATTGS